MKENGSMLEIKFMKSWDGGLEKTMNTIIKDKLELMRMIQMLQQLGTEFLVMIKLMEEAL